MKKILLCSLVTFLTLVGTLGGAQEVEASANFAQSSVTDAEVAQAVQDLDEILDFYHWALHSRYAYDIVYGASSGEIVTVDRLYDNAKAHIANFYSTGARSDALTAVIYAWDMLNIIRLNNGLTLVVNNTAQTHVSIGDDMARVRAIENAIQSK